MDDSEANQLNPFSFDTNAAYVSPTHIVEKSMLMIMKNTYREAVHRACHTDDSRHVVR